MPARYSPHGTVFRSFCSDKGCSRPLDMTVDTEDHAFNLARKHNRTYHQGAEVPRPGAGRPKPSEKAHTADLDLSGAAHAVLIEWAAEGEASTHRWEGVLTVWMALTGARDSGEALRLAKVYAIEPTTAHVAPI